MTREHVTATQSDMNLPQTDFFLIQCLSWADKKPINNHPEFSMVAQEIGRVLGMMKVGY
jgi:hypothetical protein